MGILTERIEKPSSFGVVESSTIDPTSSAERSPIGESGVSAAAPSRVGEITEELRLRFFPVSVLATEDGVCSRVEVSLPCPETFDSTGVKERKS